MAEYFYQTERQVMKKLKYHEYNNQSLVRKNLSHSLSILLATILQQNGQYNKSFIILRKNCQTFEDLNAIWKLIGLNIN